MIVRFLIVAVAALALWSAARYWPRRLGGNSHGVPTGLTLVTSKSCAECSRADAALTSAGATYVVVDAHDAAAMGIKTMTVPIAVFGNREGEAVMVRRGAAIAADAGRLAELTAQIPAG